MLNNETIAVTAISKPVDFDKPQEAKPVVVAKVDSKPITRVKDEKESPIKVSPFTANAWVIQLGVFGLKANANALEKKLNDAGYTTFNRSLKARNGKILTKVFVGPELDKSKLVKVLSKVNKVASLKGKITSFVIKR